MKRSITTPNSCNSVSLNVPAPRAVPVWTSTTAVSPLTEIAQKPDSSSVVNPESPATSSGGAIVGSALYKGAFTLSEALDVTGRP